MLCYNWNIKDIPLIFLGKKGEGNIWKKSRFCMWKKIWYLFLGKMFYLGGKNHSSHSKLNSWLLIPIFSTPWIKYHVIGDLFALTFFTSWTLSAYHVITALIHVRIHLRMSILSFDQTSVFSLIDKYDYYSLLCLPPSDNISYKTLCGTARLLVK